MADLFLVLFVYSLMLGVGPAVAWVLGRRAAIGVREKKARLEEALAEDATVLFEARPDHALAFTAVQGGIDLHIDEGPRRGVLQGLRAHAHGLTLGWRTTLYIGVPAGATEALGGRVTPLGPRIFGPRVELRAGDVELAEALLARPDVREALLDVFRPPLYGLGITLDEGGTLSVDVRLDYEPEVIAALRERTRRIVELLTANARLKPSRRVPAAPAVRALAPPPGGARPAPAPPAKPEPPRPSP